MATKDSLFHIAIGPSGQIAEELAIFMAQFIVAKIDSLILIPASEAITKIPQK